MSINGYTQEIGKQNNDLKLEMMNPVIEALYKRRTVRVFDSRRISRDVLKAVINAGIKIPSYGLEGAVGSQRQSWRFVVAEDPELKKKLIQITGPIWKKSIESMKDSHPETFKMAMMGYEAMPEPKDPVYYSAPTILFVIGQVHHAFSCELACENIMLAATSHGLGSCYVGFGALVTHNDELVQVLSLNDDERIFGSILLGYPKTMGGCQSTPTAKKEAIIKWT